MPAATRPQPYLIVDGHSIVFAWQELRRAHDQRGSTARDMLIQALRHHQDASGERVVLVFDGKGPRTSSERANPDDIRIMYSGAGRTADSVIERLVAKYAETYPITVATGDRMEQITAFAFGAICINPDMLKDRIERSARETQAVLRKLKRLR